MKFTVKDAIKFIRQAWDEVRMKCLDDVWKKLCPQFVHDFKSFSLIENLDNANKRSVCLAHQLCFDDQEDGEIEKFLQSHKVTLSKISK